MISLPTLRNSLPVEQSSPSSQTLWRITELNSSMNFRHSRLAVRITLIFWKPSCPLQNNSEPNFALILASQNTLALLNKNRNKQSSSKLFSVGFLAAVFFFILCNKNLSPAPPHQKKTFPQSSLWFSRFQATKNCNWKDGSTIYSCSRVAFSPPQETCNSFIDQVVKNITWNNEELGFVATDSTQKENAQVSESRNRTATSTIRLLLLLLLLLLSVEKLENLWL